MISVEEHNRGSVRDLLLPVKDMVGAVQKTESLITELTHPNIDWKYAITALRGYLYDYIYDILPYAGTVMPVIYHYLFEATARKKASAIRACDTFFDRCAFVLARLNEGDGRFRELADFLDSNMGDYLSLLTALSRERFYFENMHDRFQTFGALLVSTGGRGDFVAAMAQFIALQYRVYVERAIVVEEADILELAGVIGDVPGGDRLLGLLRGVSRASYGDRLAGIERMAADGPAGLFAPGGGPADFRHNTLLWEKICLTAKGLVESGDISDDDAIIHIFEFLIRKSNAGFDRMILVAS